MNEIRWSWVGISLIIMVVTQVLLGFAFTVFGLATLGMGFLLFLFLKPITYFVGGFITGYISPGITIVEPAIGVVLATVLSIIFDSQRLFPGRLIGLIFTSVIAFFLAIWGASLGERVQGN
ncbi:hypothetical protein [Spirochaeta cellobiosiphila]|uniref:hypothetical protein n=1 Tax=Spirochaeta cellobiosiphila TaxID=504483 RepID=UPI000412D684|nr:hypothetical protein [Spirochaeta cellobiosiphila]